VLFLLSYREIYHGFLWDATTFFQLSVGGVRNNLGEVLPERPVTGGACVIPSGIDAVFQIDAGVANPIPE
jgi:hypothetical protein